VHQAYIDAGAQIIETIRLARTGSSWRRSASPTKSSGSIRAASRSLVKRANPPRAKCSSRDRLVAGLGVQSRHPEPDEIRDIFHEQALALEERGVDLFCLETFTYIEEIELAIDAIRSFSGLPIIAQLTYSEEGTSYGDLRPADAARALKQKRSVIGANCTLGPQALLVILKS